jgi:uncharacterized protein YifE (UPF0438 family)
MRHRALKKVPLSDKRKANISCANSSLKGPLTAQEQILIKRYLEFYTDLKEGRRNPTTEAQRHFVAVLRNECEATTDHEFAYLKFLETKRNQAQAEDPSTRARTVGPASAKDIIGVNPHSEPPPEYYDTLAHPADRDPSDGPTESWYTREDYYKFHRRYP